MATITELVASREADISLESSSRSLRFMIAGCETEDAAEALLQQTVPAFYRTLFFQGYNLRPMGNTVWEADVRYASRQPREIGTTAFQFDTTGATVKIRQSLHTVKEYVPEGQNTIDFKRAINVGPDNKVEGVEIPIPKFSFTAVRKLPAMSQAYADILELYTGKSNKNAFDIVIQTIRYRFEVCELRYLGCTGGKTGVEDWELNLRFEVSRNVDDLQIGDIKGIKKKGWEYLWVKYVEQLSGAAVVPKPRQVNVERVLEEAPLEELFL